MKKVESSLVENIGDYACKLLTAHPSLCSFAQDLSAEDLVQLASLCQSGSSRATRPPTEFTSEVKRVVSQKAWRRLTTLLEKWHNVSEGENRFSVVEREYLTMGLLWQPLLIIECKRWHEAIQKEVASMGKVT